MSQASRYTSTDVSSNNTVFEFISCGPKGEIKKVIQFSKTKVNNVFTLAFGNILKDGTIDDITINDNKDRNKILATVASTVYRFTEFYPERYIFFMGNNLQRTRLYRMAITINYKELAKTFTIWGLRKDEEFELFKSQHNYIGFLIKRK
jgi:hypothetical protein